MAADISSCPPRSAGFELGGNLPACIAEDQEIVEAMAPVHEPIVCTPEEAIDCFKRTRMDVLAIGPYLVLKTDN